MAIIMCALVPVREKEKEDKVKIRKFTALGIFLNLQKSYDIKKISSGDARKYI